MKLTFITTNRHKVEEMQEVLKNYDIELEQKEIDYPEDKEADMSEVCKKASKELAEKLQTSVIVEDTGLFFKAYNNFPGALPKFIYNSIGFDGIFKLLKDENRSAYFKTFIGYCEPKKEPVLFDGEMQGKITEEIILPDADAMPYDHIFIPDGYDRAIVEMSIEEKNSFSQRGKATKKLGDYLKNNSNF